MANVPHSMEKKTKTVTRVRRAHTKSHTGCGTCRQRKIRCDGFHPVCLNCTKKRLRCAYLHIASYTEPEASRVSGQLVQYLYRCDSFVGIEWTSLEPYPIPSRDRYLISRTVEVATQTSRYGKEAFLVAKMFPELLRLSHYVDYVRFSMCALVTFYVGMLTKTSSIDLITLQYKGLALRGLSAALSEPQEKAPEPIFAASFLLSWVARDTEEFAELMKGVSLALEMTDDLHIDTYLVRYWRPPLRIDVIPRLPLELVVRQILLQLFLLKPYIRYHEESVQGLKEVLCYVSNLCIIPLPDTIPAQLKAIYPIRCWLPWAPGLVDQICLADPLAAIFQAHYHMVIVAVMPYFPAAIRYFALPERCAQIEALWELLRELSKTSTALWAKDLETLMEYPRLIARQHHHVDT